MRKRAEESIPNRLWNKSPQFRSLDFLLVFAQVSQLSNLVPRVFSLSNMVAAGEKTLEHSELERSLIGAFHGAFIRALSLVYSFQNKEGGPLRASWRLRSAFFRVWDLKSGQNSGLIVWKTVTVSLEGNHSKIVRGFNSCFHGCSACVLSLLRYPRSSFSQTSCFRHLEMRTISYEISEMVIAGNIIRHRGIYRYLCCSCYLVCVF